jgi:hypothetical protein
MCFYFDIVSVVLLKGLASNIGPARESVDYVKYIFVLHHLVRLFQGLIITSLMLLANLGSNDSPTCGIMVA